VIVRQYGTRVQSVEPNFDAHAMTEIGFRRDNEWSMPTEEFHAEYEKLEAHELTAAAEGEVQSETEASLLSSLEEQLLAVRESAGEGVVFIESEQGNDYPKTKHTQLPRVVDGHSSLVFRFTVEPPLRVAVYRRR
jgi:hypothetical protein